MCKSDLATNPKPWSVFRELFPPLSLPDPPHCLFHVTASITTAVFFFSISGHVWRPSLFKEGLWPEEKIKISLMSTSTLSIYMNTEPASSITRAATLLSSIFSLFFLLWLLPCNTAVWERSTSLLFFLLQALFIGYCVRGSYFLQSVVPCLVSWPATSY